MSEVLDPPVIGPVTAGLADLEVALDRLDEVEAWMVGSGELVEATATLHRLRNRADSAFHALVREVDARGAAVAQGAPSTSAWLRERLHLHPAAARRAVSVARALHDEDPAGPLAPSDDTETATGHVLLREAFATGDVTAEHVSVAADALATLPPTVDAATVSRAEAYLVEQARLHNPKALGHLGRHLRHVLDPERGDTLAAEEEHHRATRSLDVRQRADGSADLRGHLDPELTASLLSHLTPLASPRPAADGSPDLRTTGQRNADALADLLKIAAGADGTPIRHGSRPTVTVTMALETLERRLGAPGATLDWSGPICAESARRLACDARVVPVVLGADGQPLDVGRASYPVTAAIWRALVVRDGGCAFAGCDRPPEWTEAHHRTHWEDGGETSVQNCCLLCDHHHRVVHHHGWDVELIDGVIHVVPPPWVDPDGTPRRNIRRAELAALATVSPAVITADVATFGQRRQDRSTASPATATPITPS
jgi:hypothetical protein